MADQIDFEGDALQWANFVHHHHRYEETIFYSFTALSPLLLRLCKLTSRPSLYSPWYGIAVQDACSEGTRSIY